MNAPKDPGQHHDHPGHAPGHAHRHGDSHTPAPSHTSGHGHTHNVVADDLDWERLATHLETGGELHLPAHRSTAARLRELVGPGRQVRRVLDIGSGPGVMTCVLAEAFPDAEVVAVDGTPALLDRALARAERLGLAGRVSVRHARLPEGLAEDALGTADLVWSSKAVHHLGDQQGALDALARVLRPGGTLAVAEGGLPMRFLPRDLGFGRPGLQTRLDALQEDRYQAMRTSLPGSVPVVEDWPAMLRRAGLTGVGAFTTLLDLPAPLGEPGRDFLHSQLTRLRDASDGSLDAPDMDTLDRLLDPAAPEGLLRRPDVFLLSAATVFAGTRPAR
ncbi:class I SAM-dependent methyltransferase [Streptomyces sp. NPDC004667]|uniref:class I SAM-dependent methyltransferase n=1 Tax=Streptomyces sp. NPDC004667 TaxID=3154285 RepID=UPI0033A70D82